MNLEETIKTFDPLVTEEYKRPAECEIVSEFPHTRAVQ